MNNKTMMPEQVALLEETVLKIERLCDNWDLILETIKDELAEAQEKGFDRDALCLVVRRRVGDESGQALRHRAAMKYLHALGDIECADACGMVREKSAA